MPPSILAPPIVPTQSLVPTYHLSVLGRPPDRRQLQHHDRRSRASINPLLNDPGFQNYRKKQDEKEDREDQKWPQVLEDAFLDGLLVIPHIGRKKYSVSSASYCGPSLFGRNMLLGQWIWLAYCAGLPPGFEPDEKMMRPRKMVSSHIQVLKGIFKDHKFCHIFLPKEIKKGKNTTEDLDPVSLKRHPVLVAISEGRLPDERPNYSYFERIFALNSQIVIRPKRCWIFVSNREVTVHDDGSGCYVPGGEPLASIEYPHMVRNLEREKWAKEEQQIFQGTLLHEYTKNFSRVEGCALSELSRDWEGRFPDLHQRLEAIVAANAHDDVLTAESRLDIIHMDVMLELNQGCRFPKQSELNSWVEINIEKPHLLQHRWKVETLLVRPAELSYTTEGATPELLYKTSADITVQYQHRPGCDGPRPGAVDCHCMLQHSRRDCVTVPFPADVWAPTLSNCAQYVAHPGVAGAKRRSGKVKKEVEADDESKGGSGGYHPTQMDLVPQIAMMQEIFSCAPDDVHESDIKPQGNKRWIRRGVILWTFKTIYSLDNKEANSIKVKKAEGGKTTWRYLTLLDPLSDYHLQNSLTPGEGAGYGGPHHLGENHGRNRYPPSGLSTSVPRDALMSPSPTFQEHINASMSENFSAAWRSADATDHAHNAHLISQPNCPAASHSAGYGLLGGHNAHGGLATPPPSACLTSSFAHTFDSNAVPNQVGAYMTTASQHLPSEQSSAHSSFISGSGPSFDVMSYDSSHGLPSWSNTAVTGINTSAWSAGYITADDGSQHSNPQLGWLATHDNGRSSHHDDQHQQQHHHIHWDSSAASSASTPAIASDPHHPHPHGIWAVTGTSCSSATATDDEHDGASHGWEHVGHRDSCSAVGTVSDISHEWEEVDSSHVSGATDEGSESEHDIKLEGEDGLRPSVSPGPRGVKRTRDQSGSFDGEEEYRAVSRRLVA